MGDAVVADILAHTGNGYVDDEIESDAGCNRSSHAVVHTCGEVGRERIHDDVDHAEEVGAFPHASAVAFHRACAFREHAYAHKDQELVAAFWRLLLPLLLAPFQLDSFHYAYPPHARRTVFLPTKVAERQGEDRREKVLRFHVTMHP